MTNRPPKTPSLLQQALRRVGDWLERDEASRIIAAQSTIRKMKRARLPEHVKVLPKKRQGKRKPVRGRRRYDEQRLITAVWPEDGLTESALPSIACCTRGSVDLIIGDYVLKISAGDWVLFPAGVPKQDGSKAHFEGDATGRSGDVLWIYSGKTRLDGLTLWMCCSEGEEHYKLQNAYCRINNPFLAHVFDTFCEEVQEKHRPKFMLKLLALILFMVSQEIDAKNVSKEIVQFSSKSNRQNEIGGPIAEALIYIDENLHRHLTIEKVARQVMVSPATFKRYFKQETGETFGRYQTKRRLERAQLLLKTTNMPVYNVSQHIGLQYGQMRNLFQKKHGCSPTEYRERKKMS